MKKENIKIFKSTINAINDSIIAAFKQIAKEHGGKRKYIEFNDNELYFTLPDSEDSILGFDAKGNIVYTLHRDNDEFNAKLSDLPIELLLLILEALNKKFKLG